MSTELTVSDVVPAAPRTIYDAWLDSEGHTAMTGGEAHASAEVGGSFDAWDGYISGTNLELGPGLRVVQAWRTQQFEEEHDDSRIEVTFEDAPGGGSLVTIRHSGIPEGQPDYGQGWVEHYLEPMKRHFGD